MSVPAHSNYVRPPTPPPSYLEAISGDSNISENNRCASTESVATQDILGRNSMHMICPSCHAEIKTTTITRPGTFTYVSAFFTCLFTFGLGCFLIPFCIDDCKEVDHSCPNCEESLDHWIKSNIL
ncbi:cell death-inducing p53-target protein 1 [Drosophila rhopaloa]|uniref:Cell death-inducing p53-target protein 1-like n=1 Tax=Drosophila rhopaloa TaxID=1041015 RepID=A0A6P4E0Z7_DRORH|nr:cell death-inducing p53-target protein 1 [Drosophila rhopaloa]